MNSNERIRSFTKLIDKIPDYVHKAFVHRSIRDARRIIDDGRLDVQNLSYVIYRAYMIGILYGSSGKVPLDKPRRRSFVKKNNDDR